MKAIYKLTAIVVILFTTFTGSAQSRSYRIFDEFAHKDGFINLAFSKAMIDVVDLKIDEENKKITGDLMEIRILISDREKNKIEGSLSKIISGKFQKMDYKKVEPKNEAENDNIELWIDGDSKKVRECHVIVMNSEDDQFSCLVSFYGNFKVEDLKSFEKFSRKQANKQ